ncbi:MAG: DUF4956 domain-containing protein [Oscillospiraceae bacterium]|nr:DUF4956 domain-containing protein [Oscillospiraceae bacterium]
MNMSDIFKKSFLNGFEAADINAYTALAAMLLSCVLALYIFTVYRVVTRKTFYSKSFGVSLAGICLITAGIILTIQSSIVVSLGMVGALSIVRFRTAIKDPMDLMFLFWSIAAGIICGVGLAEIALILSVLLTVGILVLDKLPVAKAPLLLVINADDRGCEARVMEIVGQFAKYSAVKSRSMTKTSFDLVVELRTANGAELIGRLLEDDGITAASLMSHDGETTF